MSPEPSSSTHTGVAAAIAAAAAAAQTIHSQAAGAHLFNPYAQRCPIHDGPDAPAIRLANLTLYLAAQLECGPRALWLAEAPGARGLRRTGLPLIAEPRVAAAGRRLGLSEPFARATHTPAQAPATANAVWAQIECRPGLPLLWNLLMQHPHPLDRPLANRPTRAAERDAGVELLELLLARFEIRQTVAIGRVAEHALRRLGRSPVYVRHPAQGGLAAFRRKMAVIAHQAPAGPGSGSHRPVSLDRQGAWNR